MVADKIIKMKKVSKLVLKGERETILGEAYVVDEKLQWNSFE